LFSLFAAWISVSTAQTTGTLSGRITERSGAGVPNATVIVTNVNTNASQRVLSAPDGTFTIVSLPPGTYRIEIESAGFKRASQQNIELVAGTAQEITIVLEGGEAATTVEAQATTRTIQDDNGEIAKSLGQYTINELLVLDRNYQAYMDLFSGIPTPTTAGSITESPQQNRVWNTNGQPNSSNLRLMDGAKNHEPATGRSVHIMPMHAVKQLNVVNSGYEPQYGRVGGSVINTLTSPGTNDFHGNVFYLYSNDQFNARNYFNRGPRPKDHFRSNQFGGAVGGRIVRDRVFFFGAYEGGYVREGRTQIATVPTADFRAGNFGAVPNLNLYNPATGTPSGAGRAQFAGGMIPSGMINPTSQAIASALPQPNSPGLINNYITSPIDRMDAHRGIGRLDFYVTEQTNLFGRYGYSNYLTFVPNVFQSEELGGGSNARLRNHNAGISVAHRFSPTFTLDALANFSRYNNRQWGTGIADASAFGFGDVTANGQLPNISIAGLQIGNNPLFPYRDTTDSYNVAVNGGWTRGRHKVKFGFDVWHSRMNGYEQFMWGRNSGYFFGPGGTLNMGQGTGDLGGFPNAFASFLVGAPTQVSGFNQGMIPHFRTTEYAGYVGDTWRVTERLALNFGVRYSAFSPVETRENASFFNFGTSQFTPFDTGDTDLSGAQSWDSNNFAPRFGFAYRFAERTVLRGAYAISYFRPNLTWYAQSFLPDGFSTFQQGVATDYATVTRNYATLPLTGTPSEGLPSGPVAILRDDINTPYLQSYNVQIQHDFGAGASLDVAYVGNLGRHLPFTQDLNVAEVGTGVAGLPMAGRTAALYELGAGLNSNYNALQATFNKRFTNWVSFAGQYTWSRAMDYGDAMTPLFNSLNRQDNYGPADWDRRHMFTLSHIWEPLGANFRREGWVGALLGGWRISGILRAFSGQPMNLTADPLLCACPGNTARASVGSFGRTEPNPEVSGFFVGNPLDFPISSFGQPAAGTQGNLGRNSVYAHDFWESNAWNYDASVTKAFQITEQNRLEVKGDVFNVTNTPHFAAPVANVNNVNFGRSFTTVPGFGGRTIRLGARYVF
jgi:hypothetical protein